MSVAEKYTRTSDADYTRDFDVRILFALCANFELGRPGDRRSGLLHDSLEKRSTRFRKSIQTLEP